MRPPITAQDGIDVQSVQQEIGSRILVVNAQQRKSAVVHHSLESHAMARADTDIGVFMEHALPRSRPQIDELEFIRKNEAAHSFTSDGVVSTKNGVVSTIAVNSVLPLAANQQGSYSPNPMQGIALNSSPKYCNCFFVSCLLLVLTGVQAHSGP